MNYTAPDHKTINVKQNELTYITIQAGNKKTVILAHSTPTYLQLTPISCYWHSQFNAEEAVPIRNSYQYLASEFPKMQEEIDYLRESLYKTLDQRVQSIHRVEPEDKDPYNKFLHRKIPNGFHERDVVAPVIRNNHVRNLNVVFNPMDQRVNNIANPRHPVVNNVRNQINLDLSEDDVSSVERLVVPDGDLTEFDRRLADHSDDEFSYEDDSVLAAVRLLYDVD